MTKPIISIIMGSKIRLDNHAKTAEVLDRFGVAYERKLSLPTVHQTSCSNMPKEARSRGIKVIIAGAGGAAHLPGMVAAKQPFLSLVCPSNHVLLVAWTRSTLSFRCRVEYQSRPWLSVKQVRQMRVSLPFVSFQ